MHTYVPFNSSSMYHTVSDEFYSNPIHTCVVMEDKPVVRHICDDHEKRILIKFKKLYHKGGRWDDVCYYCSLENGNIA